MTSSEKINLAEFLNQQHLCASLTIKEVQILIDYTELVTFKKGDIIANIGDVGEALYFVVAGEAALVYDESGAETEVGRMQEGELMGEMSFFDRQPRSVRMRAVTGQCKLLKLTRTMYNRLRVEHPYIAVNLLEHAIVSLDHLIRRMGTDVATFSHYLYGRGKK
ncbi:MAG: cyclic nucleotide-binding domain-containing protein [Pseudomonadota bacterium]